MGAEPTSWVRRAGVLVLARLAAQGVSFVWVLWAARSLPRSEMGAVGVGLTVLAVTSALAELGTTRSVVRHGGADPASLRPTLVAALGWRVAAGVVVGGVVAAAAGLVGVPAPGAVVVLAVVVSATSGVVDLLLAGLRTAGAVRTEAVVLVGERTAFLVLGGLAVARGGGATTVLVVYLATNLASLAVVGPSAARALQPAVGGVAGPLLDAEGRRTAVATAVGALLPRLAAVIVAVGGTATGAAAVAVAQRPFDALVVLVATGMSAIHPVARRAVATGAVAEAQRVIRAATTVAVAVALAALGVAALAPTEVLGVLAGRGRYADAAGVLVAAGVVAVVSVLRQALEVAALAEERAGVVARAELVALVTGGAVGLALVGPWGAVGAVAAQVLAEAVAAAGIALGRRSWATAGPAWEDGAADVGGRREGERWDQPVEGAAV